MGCTRADAASLFSLVRNIGSGVGISVMTAVLARMASVNHEELASRLVADAPAVRNLVPGLLSHSADVAARMDALVGQQAAMVAYVDNFLLMLGFTIAALPIVFLLRRPGAAAPHAPAQAKAD